MDLDKEEEEPAAPKWEVKEAVFKNGFWGGYVLPRKAVFIAPSGPQWEVRKYIGPNLCCGRWWGFCVVGGGQAYTEVQGFVLGEEGGLPPPPEAGGRDDGMDSCIKEEPEDSPSLNPRPMGRSLFFSF